MRYEKCQICNKCGTSQHLNLKEPYICPSCEKRASKKAKAARKAKIEAMRACVITNSIITALSVFIVTVLSLTYSYDYRDYFAIGGEIILICATAFLSCRS